MKKASILDLVNLNAYYIGLSFMWNSLHIIILPAVLLNFVPDHLKNTYLGLMTFAGLVIAMVVQPLSGAISDHWRSPWGKRRPLILAGTLLDFLFLAFLGYAGGLGWLAIGYIGLQFSSNVAHGPIQGLLPDKVPPKQLGAASGFKNLMDMAGLVAASLVMGRLIDPEAAQPAHAIALVALILAGGAAITLLGVKEAASAPAGRKQWEGFKSGMLQLDLRQNAGFWWLVLSRFIFLLGIYDIQTFIQYYIRDVLDVPNPVQLTGDLMAVITLALIVFAVAGGWVGDRAGHKRLLVLASILTSAGCLLLMMARTPTTLLAFGSVVGVGAGLFLTSNWALANALVPANEAGKFMGFTNLATAGAGAIARLGGPAIDLLNNARPGLFWGYLGLFLFGAICTLGSAWFLRRVPGK